MANSFVITAVIKLNNFSKLCFTYNFTMSVWLLQCGNREQEFKVQLNLKYHMYYIHLMSKIKALNVFEMSFSFSLAFSPTSSLVLSLTFFVLSVLRSLSFVITFVCFALELIGSARAERSLFSPQDPTRPDRPDPTRPDRPGFNNSELY